MAIESRMRRPLPFGQPESAGPPKKRPWPTVFSLLVIVLGLAALWWWWQSRPSPEDVLSELGNEEEAMVELPSGTFQAVFLDNGQTYFGKIEERSPSYDGYYRLSNVYYLDLRQNPQDTTLPTSELKLVKLGGEVHGPDDHMDINKDHVLFIEDLKSDSKVAKAINDYLQSKQ
jgi:hypothetical protein